MIFLLGLIGLSINYVSVHYKVIATFLLASIGFLTVISICFRLFYGKQPILKLGKEFMIGNDLILATKNFLNDLPKPKTETTANLIGHLVYRFTRLGIVGILLALIPIWLLFNQNQLITKQNEVIESQTGLIANQNKRLDQQTYLQEAERRSALIFIYGGLLETINQEVKEAEEKTGRRNLSPQIIGQIIALSQRMKPYRYLENDSLISKPLSPERSQLLISLIESKLDSSTYLNIFKKADFSYADLESVNLEGQDLRYINLSYSNLKGANLRYTKLDFANLSKTELDSVDLVKSSLFLTNLNNSHIYGTDFRTSSLKSSFFIDCKINNTKFDYADLRNTVFDKSVIENVIFRNARFDNVDTINNDNPNFFRGIMKEYFDENKLDTIQGQINPIHHPNSSFKNTILKKVNFKNANLTNLQFNHSKIENSIFDSSNLSGTSFDSVLISNSTYKLSLVNGTSFRNVSLKNLNFDDAQFPEQIIQPNLKEQDIEYNFTIDWGENQEIKNLNYDSIYQMKLISSIMVSKNYIKDTLSLDELFVTGRIELVTFNANSKGNEVNFSSIIDRPFWWESFLLNNEIENRMNFIQLKMNKK